MPVNSRNFVKLVRIFQYYIIIKLIKQDLFNLKITSTNFTSHTQQITLLALFVKCPLLNTW